MNKAIFTFTHCGDTQVFILHEGFEIMALYGVLTDKIARGEITLKDAVEFVLDIKITLEHTMFYKKMYYGDFHELD